MTTTTGDDLNPIHVPPRPARSHVDVVEDDEAVVLTGPVGTVHRRTNTAGLLIGVAFMVIGLVFIALSLLMPMTSDGALSKLIVAWVVAASITLAGLAIVLGALQAFLMHVIVVAAEDRLTITRAGLFGTRVIDTARDTVESIGVVAERDGLDEADGIEIRFRRERNPIEGPLFYDLPTDEQIWLAALLRNRLQVPASALPQAPE